MKQFNTIAVCVPSNVPKFEAGKALKDLVNGAKK